MSRQLPILHTTYQDDSLRRETADVSRRAVRGLTIRDGKILTVYSEVNGDYKFPGGGVEEGESDSDALARELSEECGYRLIRLGAKFAVVAEYKHAMEADAAVFRMESHYYFAGIDAGQGEQLLDDYEQQLRFRPAWVTIDQALQSNTHVMERSAAVPSWTARETWVLRALAAYGTENALPYAPPSDRSIISECGELD